MDLYAQRLQLFETYWKCKELVIEIRGITELEYYLQVEIARGESREIVSTI